MQGSKGVGERGGGRNGNGGSFGLPWKIRNIPTEATIERCMLYTRSQRVAALSLK